MEMVENAGRQPRTDLTVSIATWNNCELLCDCLRSIASGLDLSTSEVFVVDNASSDGTAEAVGERFPWVRLVRNDRPRGFSANHNQVLRRARGRFVLLLNDDTVVVGDALRQAMELLEARPDAGAVGCTLIRPDGTPERVSQRFPHPLDPIFPRLRRKVDPKREIRSGPDAVEVDRLSGACLMVRREVLERVGLLDEQFDPAYGEDTDLCFRIKQAGWRIYRLPYAKVIHYRGRTAMRELDDRAGRIQEAKILWYRKHRSRAALLLYRASNVAASIARIAVCLALLLLPWRRVETRARMQRLWSRLRATLGLA